MTTSSASSADAINDMANDLQLLVRQMESTAERDGFGSQLAEALEMADTEPEALVDDRAGDDVDLDDVPRWRSCSPTRARPTSTGRRRTRTPVRRAARSSRRSAASPCGAATRSSSTNSEALNACPKLQGRASGADVGGLCAGDVHGPRPRRAPRHRRRRLATRRRRGGPVDGAGHAVGRTDRHRALVRAVPAAGHDGRADRSPQPSDAGDRAALGSSTTAQQMSPGDGRSRPLQVAQRHLRPRGR